MIKYSVTYKRVGVIFMTCLLFGCIEPFDAEFTDFEDVFVVDATITDEMKRQQIRLTKTYRFQDEIPPPEVDAIIIIKDDLGNEFVFEETDSGNYLSTVAFAALPQRTYQLLIATQSGKKYSSQTMELPQKSKIDTIYAKRITNDFGEDGMAIFVGGSNPNGGANFYRYEFEETYKVIAPQWAPTELDVDEGPPESIIFVPRPLGEKTCYARNDSNGIILVDTEGVEGGEVSNFMVRFVNRDNYIISHRYSILVRQYAESLEAYNFLETLKDFSTNESLFSETQPGFLEGNIFSEENDNEKILGYFKVSAVTEKRVFFNYEDFFPGERLPPYVDPCRESAPLNGLTDLIRWNMIKYIKDNNGEFDSPTSGPYITVPRVCGDCTALGESEIPDFWIE